MMVETYWVECYIAGEYRNKLDLPDFFDVLESAVCDEYMKGRTQAGFTAESLFTILREAHEMYSGDKAFYSADFGSKDSVSGQFGERVTAKRLLQF